MREKNITFIKKINIQHHDIYGDTIKLREVFLNLISNAYKYTMPGGSVTMQLDEIPCSRKDYVRFRTTISDTGIGISEEFLPHIFEEFSREHTTTDIKIEGTGLGMPIVKKLRIAAIDAGMNAHLAKPIVMDNLFKTLSGLLL